MGIDTGGGISGTIVLPKCLKVFIINQLADIFVFL